jgi:hypothetical protein
MKHIKEYKIFESNENIRDIIHECFIPVEDLTTVFVNINRAILYDIATVKIQNLNSEICEEVANAVSHCIGMGLYYYGATIYYNQGLDRIFATKSFTSLDIEEFYNFITSSDRKDEPKNIRIYLKNSKLKKAINTK